MTGYVERLVEAAQAVLETDEDDCPDCGMTIQEGEGLCGVFCPRNDLVVALRPFNGEVPYPGPSAPEAGGDAK